ncbi:TetR-like C-terminal domain-containing protein [Catenulispora yoronensis]
MPRSPRPRLPRKRPPRTKLLRRNARPRHPRLHPAPETTAAAKQSLQVLHEAARWCIETGHFHPDSDPTEITDILWAAAHGIISLERAGHFPHPGPLRYRTLTTAAAAAFTTAAAEPQP